jgi:hypothetical protein
MKSVLFFAIVCILGIILWTESKKVLKMEPFQDVTPKGASPTLNVPKTKPDPATLYPGSPQPFAPPTTALLAPPPGQTASVNSYVYEDPALKKADPRRLQSVLQSLKGFLANEAPGLQSLGDPSVTLPLGVARADAQRLEDEFNVLARNPGMQSSMTMDDLDKVEANLGSLQRKWRMSANSVGNSVEGFQVPTGTASPKSRMAAEGFQTTPSAFSPSGPMTAVGYLQQWFGNPSANYFQAGLDSASGTGGAGASGTPTVPMATLQNLKDLIVAITRKIQQLNNSGSQDPDLLNRVTRLEAVKKGVQAIIDKIEISKTLTEAQIPIKKAEFTAFMAALTGGTELPTLTMDTGESDSGSGSGGGPTQNIQDLFSALGPDAAKNISFDWDIKLRYTGETERTLAEEAIKAAAMSALPGSEGTVSTYGPGDETVDKTGYRGAFDSIIKWLSGKGSPDVVTGISDGSSDSGSSASSSGGVPTIKGTLPGSKNGAPATLDWKQKSAEICDQIKKREMDPYEFGCMKDTTTVSENFSYRGYAKMICARLGTNYDPSIPELCGCPPPTWAGWRQ